MEFHDLAKRYNRRQVFSGLNGLVSEGRSLVITGANGSGKSTLVRVLCGLARPSRGQVVVHVDGVALAPADCRAEIGLVAPDLSLYGEQTAEENLSFFARVRGLELTKQDFGCMLERVGLAGRGGDPVSEYSSGMRQRLKYAHALLHRPRLLFLDEPTANLDEAGSAIVADIIAEQKTRGILVLATNEPEEVAFGDEVLRLGA
ncbi:MAG: ABC transporter ATP-binding protein [Chloroflexota bacterium]|nr:ABC transporter ATP-binding protein [Chloroflexota bacterium]